MVDRVEGLLGVDEHDKEVLLGIIRVDSSVEEVVKADDVIVPSSARNKTLLRGFQEILESRDQCRDHTASDDSVIGIGDGERASIVWYQQSLLRQEEEETVVETFGRDCPIRQGVKDTSSDACIGLGRGSVHRERDPVRTGTGVVGVIDNVDEGQCIRLAGPSA